MPTFRNGLSTAQRQEYDRLGPGEKRNFRRDYNSSGNAQRRASLRPSSFKQSNGFYNPASGSSE